VFMGGIVKRAAGIRTGKRLVHLFAMLPPAGGRPVADQRCCGQCCPGY
jgi:hypothetical protein